MIFKFKSKNYEIIDYEKPITRDIIVFCRKGYQKNQRFFERNSSFFKVIVCHSEAKFKKEMKKWYLPMAKGRTLKNKIVIRGPKEIIKCHKELGGAKSFNGVIAHEMAHLFEVKYFGERGEPMWLNEGLADFVNVGKRKLKIKEKDF